MIETLISFGKATLHELQTVYGLEDAYDLLELAVVEHNNRPKRQEQ